MDVIVEPLKRWNVHVLKLKKKNKLLGRIASIHKALCRSPNNFLLNLERELISEFNGILNQEAIFWHQKSRLKWLQDDDCNT